MGRLGGCLRTGFVCTPPLSRFGPSEFAQLFKYERDSKYKHKENHATCRFLWVDTCFYQTAQKSRGAAFSYEFTSFWNYFLLPRLCSKFQRSSQLCESPIVTWSSWIARTRARAGCYDFRGEEPIMARKFSNRASCRVDLVGSLVFPQPYFPTKEIPILHGAAYVNGCTPPLSSPTRLQSLDSNISPCVRTVVERRQRRPTHCLSPEYNTFVIPIHACRI